MESVESRCTPRFLTCFIYGMSLIPDEIKGGSGSVIERRGKWRNMDSVLSGFNLSELLLSQLCMSEIHFVILLGEYSGELVQLR